MAQIIAAVEELERELRGEFTVRALVDFEPPQPLTILVRRTGAGSTRSEATEPISTAQPRGFFASLAGRQTLRRAVREAVERLRAAERE